MKRISFAVGAAMILASSGYVYAASTQMAAIAVSSFSAPAPTSNRNTLNAVKGTASYSFRISGRTNSRTLVAYGNGANLAGDRQCVELIKRYAAGLGFANFAGRVNARDVYTGSTALGNGNQVASNFARESQGSFVFVTNGGSTLPKPGAVLSVASWTGAAGAGHVGIVLNYTQPSSSQTSVTVTLFEQNMPIDSWKTVTFTKTNGRWSGTMRNGTSYPSVVGWANPAG